MATSAEGEEMYYLPLWDVCDGQANGPVRVQLAECESAHRDQFSLGLPRPADREAMRSPDANVIGGVSG